MFGTDGRMRMESGGRATRRRQPLAMSVVALLVVIALAAGVGCGFLLVRPAIPESLRSSTASGSITAAKSRFDDARDVTVTVHTGTGRTVASPRSGTITAYGCAPGQTIDFRNKLHRSG